MADNRNWIWVNRVEGSGNGFDEYICVETQECKQVWDDGYVEIFEIAK